MNDSASSAAVPVLLRALFEALAPLRYAVMRNYETLPEAVPGTDIDLLVTPHDRPRAIDAIEAASAAVGWRVCWRYAKDYRIDQLVLAAPDGASVVRIDLVSGLGWRGAEYAEPGALLATRVEERGIAHLARPEAVAALLAGAALYRGGLQAKYHDALAEELRDLRPAVEALLSRMVGPVAVAALDAITAGDVPRFEACSAEARAWVRRTSWRRPLRAVLGRAWFGRFALGRAWRPPGILIAVLGPHGGGKSTIVAGLVEALRPVAPQVPSAYLRPQVLPDLAAVRAFLLRRPRPAMTTAPAPTNPTRFGSWTRLLYYALDYSLGYAIRIRRIRMRAGIVVSDRWHYDYAVDQQAKNVSITPDRITRIVRWLPQPDLAILAAPSPEVAAERRPEETTPAEAVRQVEGFERALRACGQPYVRLSTDGPPEVAIAAAHAAVLDFLARREARHA